MNRRNFLFGGSAIALLPTIATAECVPLCSPGPQPGLTGTGTGNPTLNPTFCTSDFAHDLMTVQWNGYQWIRLGEFAWYYGLMYPNGGTEFYGTKVANRRCQDRQSFHSGTRAIMWMNCLSREDYVTWTRYWFITRPIVDNRSDYTLDLYHTEPARSYEDAPATVPPFRNLIG